jgi:hypothetical protein
VIEQPPGAKRTMLYLRAHVCADICGFVITELEAHYKQLIATLSWTALPQHGQVAACNHHGHKLMLSTAL